METNTQHVHFRVGADMGRTLMQIANEHLLYGNDLDKALSTLDLGEGCDEALQMQLLSGEKIILVDEDEQVFTIVERVKYPHLDNIYPAVLDFQKFVEDKQKELDDHCDSLDKGLDFIINKFRYRSTYNLDVPIESLMKYIYGNDENFIADIMDSLEYDDDIQQMKSLIRVTKDFIEKSLKLSDMVRRLKGMYGFETELNTYDLVNLVQKVQDIARAEFTMFTEGSDEVLTSYMEASKDIDETLKSGLEPVNIMENYSAGWLSPEGEYYALNGEIANMLHNQISVALQEQGKIPMHEVETDGVEINPDAWLEQAGWLKIHGNNVQFGGCLNDKIGLKNVNMTKKQIEIVRDYISECHACMIKAGWRLEKASIGMFTAMAMKNPDAVNAKYFSFD